MSIFSSFVCKTGAFFLSFSLLAGVFSFPAILEWKQYIKSATQADSTVPLTVILDAGHGGDDGGTACAEGVLEKDLNLAITKKLADYLTDAGIRVILTRSEDLMLYDRNSNYQGQKKIQDLRKRLEIAEEAENPLFISIHQNSFPQAKYSGLQVWYSQNHPNSQIFAKLLQEKAKSQFQPENDREIKPATSSIYLLYHLQCPAVLIECGFLSNPTEAQKLQSDSYQYDVAFLIFLSILKYSEVQE